MYFEHRMKKTLCPVLLLLFCLTGYSQKEWSNWYYGGDNVLTFKNGFPQIAHGFVQPKPTQYDPYNYYYWGGFTESVSYSDPATGTMRFLVSSGTAFGPDYTAFPKSRTQRLRSCIEDNKAYHIVPFFNNPDKFYLIQFQDNISDLLAQQSGLQVKCPNSFGLAYSIIDMQLNGGLGDFTTMNQQITTNLTGQMTTVKHANGHDVWVIVHPAGGNTFSARLVSDIGIAAPVNSNIGPVVTGSYANHEGELTASRDGKMLAGYSEASKTVQLFDFDNATGAITNYRALPYKEYVWSMQFSPDDSKLYYCASGSLYQYDLNQPDIGNSLTKILGNGGNMVSMQLYTDGKIYISRLSFAVGNDSKDYVGVIQCPNLPQYACNFDPRALEATHINIAPLINDLVKDPKAAPVTKFSLGNDTTICSGSYTLNAPPGWQSYKWNTGDITQSITVTKPGLYHVLTGNTGFNCPSGYGYINIFDKGKDLELGPDTSLCAGTTYQLHVDNNFSNILWENGSNSRDSLITTPSIYKVMATGKDGCPSLDSIMITIKNDVHASFGNDTALCNGSVLPLQLLPAKNTNLVANYSWQDGTVQDRYTVNKAGKYWGTVHFAGCTASDTINVAYMNVLNAALGSDTSICTGDSLVLKTAVSNASYIWNTGASTQQITVKTPGAYFIQVNNGLCNFFDTINISSAPRPLFSLGHDTTICSNESLTLAPALQNGKWLWQDGSANQQYKVQLPGTYWLQFIQNGCGARDTVQIAVAAAPSFTLGKDTSLCEGKILLLNAFLPDIIQYQWQDGSTNANYQVKKAGNYQVTILDKNNCAGKDAINIVYTPLPSVQIAGDTVICGGKPVMLTVKANYATGLLWQNGSTSQQLLADNSGQYSITATNTCGTATAQKNISKGVCNLILPSAFTPNNDRENDVFRVKYPFETRQFQFTVYNRWGEKIFESTDIRKGWDGHFKGQLQPSGNYIWFITLTDADNHFQQVHGSVMLIR